MLFIRKALVYGALLLALLLITYSAEVSSLCTHRSKTYKRRCRSNRECAMACRSEHRTGGYCHGASSGISNVLGSDDGSDDLTGNAISKSCICTDVCHSPPPPPPQRRRKRPPVPKAPPLPKTPPLSD